MKIKNILVLFIVLFLVALPVGGCLLLEKIYCCSGWFDYVGAIVTYVGTTTLGGVTIWQQKKYSDMADKKDKLQQDYIKEEHRLSFLPYFISSYSEILPTDIPKNMDVIEFQSATEYKYQIEEFDTSTALHTLEQIGKYIYILYSICNVGRDNALFLSLKIDSYEKDISAVIKNEEKQMVFKFDPSMLKDSALIINFEFTSLDGIKYSQNDTFSILTETHSGENKWTISKESINPPKVIQKGEYCCGNEKS